jgi:RimJ/RimL family protein N-acetyltransferase
MASPVSLREVIDSDIAIFFEHQRDPAAVEMAAFPAGDKQAHEEHWIKIRNQEGLATWTILAGDEVAGNIGCWRQNDRRLIGYWIGRDHWGKGIATSALAQCSNSSQSAHSMLTMSRATSGQSGSLRNAVSKLNPRARPKTA